MLGANIHIHAHLRSQSQWRIDAGPGLGGGGDNRGPGPGPKDRAMFRRYPAENLALAGMGCVKNQANFEIKLEVDNTTYCKSAAVKT